MRIFRPVALFLALLGFWLALSARLDPLFVVMGALSAAGVTWFSLHLFHHAIEPTETAPRWRIVPMLTFLVWLVSRIPPAGIQIANTVLHPRRSPRPGVFTFKTNLSSPAARTALANSITLVPGTMTLSVDDDEFTVHAFNPKAAEDLATAATQRKIARAFGDHPDDPPKLVWSPVHDVLPQEDA